MRKGTIVLVPFPFTDLSGKKIRPAVVLWSDKRGEDCICAFLSSSRKKPGMFDIFVKAEKQNGLKADSFLKTNKIATFQKKIILGELGSFDLTLQQEVDQKIKKLFGL
ncbi:MAG: type II toxin-antitoxin system PemK/MazF family toxin [bacterium]|nr:type II toxin-antitoxin system PemK/MazF family toxin [bacterium]